METDVHALAHHDSGCWIMARHCFLIQLLIHGAPTKVVWVKGTTQNHLVRWVDGYEVHGKYGTTVNLDIL